MINRVLDLQSLTVRQITKPLAQAVMVSAQTPTSEVLQLARERGLTRVFLAGLALGPAPHAYRSIKPTDAAIVGPTTCQVPGGSTMAAAATPRPAVRRRSRSWPDHQILRRVVQLAVAAIVAVVALERAAVGRGVATPEALCPFGGIETALRLVTGAGYVPHVHASNVVLGIGVLVLAFVVLPLLVALPAAVAVIELAS